jgi:hypothetical protein
LQRTGLVVWIAVIGAMLAAERAHPRCQGVRSRRVTDDSATLPAMRVVPAARR